MRLRLLLFLVLLLCMFPARAQDATPSALPPLEPITAVDAGEVQQLSRFGYGAITALAFSPDGQYFAVGTGIGILLYTTDDYAKSPRFLEGGTTTISFSPDSTLLASDGQLWDVATGNSFHPLRGVSPIFSSDGDHVITGDGSDIVVWNTKSGQELSRQTINYKHQNDIRKLILNADGTTLGIDTGEDFSSGI